jgi:hypothetical protein
VGKGDKCDCDLAPNFREHREKQLLLMVYEGFKPLIGVSPHLLAIKSQSANTQ